MQYFFIIWEGFVTELSSTNQLKSIDLPHNKNISSSGKYPIFVQNASIFQILTTFQPNICHLDNLSPYTRQQNPLGNWFNTTCPSSMQRSKLGTQKSCKKATKPRKKAMETKKKSRNHHTITGIHGIRMEKTDFSQNQEINQRFEQIPCLSAWWVSKVLLESLLQWK